MECKHKTLGGTFKTICDQRLHDLQELQENHNILTDVVAELRDIIPIEWFEVQHDCALAEVVGSPELAVKYAIDYVKESQSKVEFFKKQAEAAEAQAQIRSDWNDKYAQRIMDMERCLYDIWLDVVPYKETGWTEPKTAIEVQMHSNQELVQQKIAIQQYAKKVFDDKIVEEDHPILIINKMVELLLGDYCYEKEPDEEEPFERYKAEAKRRIALERKNNDKVLLQSKNNIQ